jgi:cell division protein FtsN
VLGAKQSEVQTSGSESGTWHRLVVTPASTKEAATEICNKLRAAGYARCWVKPY